MTKAARLLAATGKLLREMPPARDTISRIAQAASVDPATVRCYFGNRTALLLAAVDRVTVHAFLIDLLMNGLRKR